MPQFDSDYEAKLYADRVLKLDRIAEIGAQLGLSRAEALYPNAFRFTHTIPELLALGAAKSAEELEAQPIEAAIAGRVMSHRAQGKAGFAHLQGGGERLQVYVRKDDVGATPEQSEALFALYKLLDLGDHIGLRGSLMRTRTGELTLKAHPITLADQVGHPALVFLAKAMLALPDKYHGLEDVELRYRQRYVDLIMNSGTLAKAEVPSATPGSPGADSRTLEASSQGVEGGFSPPFAGVQHGASAPGHSPIPGTSPVTDTAAPNAQHEDAPRNVREVFVKRAAVLRAIRKFFDARGYLEVETPMMHTVAGGAAARPFQTHHNALGLNLSLRIAPELFLKRLVVGGFDRVYEINRNFRNEGVSTQHNPEFTMLEFYQAYSNYHDLMDLTIELIAEVAQEVNGTTTTHFNNIDIDLAPTNWQKLRMTKAIVDFWLPEFGPAPTEEQIRDENSFRFLIASASQNLVRTPVIKSYLDAHPNGQWMEIFKQTGAAAALGRVALYPLLILTRVFSALASGEPHGTCIAMLFEALGENPAMGHLIQPTIIYDFPLAVSPLSKVKPGEPDWVERFEFYIGGFEVGNAFSELNDAADQEARFDAQVADKDPESMSEVDTDYVRALGYGLPPTAGEGIGIDRLTMLLTGSRSIRDVILFPLLRPQTELKPKPGDPTPSHVAKVNADMEEIE